MNVSLRTRETLGHPPFIQKVTPVAPTPPAGSIGDNEVPKPNKDKYH
jgi:hypothetical protein